MNTKLFGLVAGSAFLLASCALPHVELATVGPPPTSAGIGHLQVFSPVDEHEDSDRPVYFRQHAGYSVFTPDGRQIKQMENPFLTSQEDTLELVPLPVGRYLVKPKHSRLTVPIIIKAGQTTFVHLDGGWKPPSNVPERELVKLPGGGFVGWRGDPTEESPKR